ncbi:LuxR family two component transcriptional regulator [Limnobacter thiooxidans]|uniref:Response regulator transcription factor n=1 Tax=Limnobacter thiooxidans TaxID=131080 RepID=A0AA86J5H2_9BURK|nr:response regulator transcription factor [Limnobacter sp.]MCZ8016425.1 response regulator transcription factor [Limnobacter sp.]RZS39712.1 LuxR family two component transcriptional regulator [Limnobacter thiooxidans]BET24660.1 response regulator transcription factor [Limnobacter thiooxidans]
MTMSADQAVDMEPIGVILVEDEPATQDHLVQVLQSSSALRLLGLASTVQDAYSLLFMTQPKVALIDLGLPDSSGIEIIRWLSKNKPEVEPLVITTFGDEDHVVRSLEAGATGYLLKDYSNEELINHIVEVANGGSPISPLVARQLLFRMQNERVPEPGLQQDKITQKTSPNAGSITDRELKVIQQVARGFTAQEIAAQMGISTHTVSTHVKRIYKKLHVHSRSEAVYEASLLGLLDL